MSNDDCFWKLSTLSDQALGAELEPLVSSERVTTARLVAHLAEVLDRRLHLKQAYASMTAYCREKLRLREDDAGRRIVAARLASRYPAIFPMLESGELSLSVTCKLKHYISQENHEQLLEGVRGRSYREAEAWFACKFPRIDVASRIRKLPSTTPPSPLPIQSTFTASTKPAPAPAMPLPVPRASDPLPPRSRDRGRVEPLSPARYRVEFTAGAEFRAKLDLARDLMSHSNPSGEFAPIIERALDLLIADLQKKRFGVTDRPRRARSADPRHITNAARREISARDELGCTYADDRGKRCGARAFLQHDHKHPRGLGGKSDTGNVRLLCAPHNRLEAERVYGRKHMDQAIAKRLSHKQLAKKAVEE